MTSTDDSQSTDGVPTYVQRGDPVGRFTDHYPAWLETLADNVTIEAHYWTAPRSARMPPGQSWAPSARCMTTRCSTSPAPTATTVGLEDHTAQVRGEPIGSAVLVTSNAAGQTQHVAANYRPRSSLLLLSRLVGERLAGTPFA